ncbi:MAG TPA: SusC/RagA family TonB-linked outer membrane protein [Gemmatimonadaceae bacterium]|jgi:TonB-linked SusC/RagA family outer membrane protein|nr:SusC/RagA family TonB-linked outer membrane protein [Gemmatimonadaceae bacterium]
MVARSRLMLAGLGCAALLTAVGPHVSAQTLADGSRTLADHTPRFISEPLRGGAIRYDMSGAVVLRHRITIDLSSVALADALNAVATLGAFEVSYSPDLIPPGKLVSLHAQGITVAGALSELLLDSGVDVQLSPTGHATLIRRYTGDVTPLHPKTTVSRQNRVIQGHVTDLKSGHGLGDVQIQIKGTALGTHSLADGAFTISLAPGAATLVFRRIGYQQIERLVPPEENTIAIAMVEDVLKLDQTVITGVATGVSKRNLANDVGTVSAEQLTEVQSQTVEQALQGKIAGADIAANSGAPGGGMQVRLRGTSSIIGVSDPLYVMDGVIISNAAISPGTNAITKAAGGGQVSSNEDNATNRIADLDPNDIENIEVLKGASAAAIYGSKAANGVVVITTKRGHSGSPKIDMAQLFGFSSLSKELGSRTFRDSASAVGAFGQGAAPYFAHGMVPRTFNHDEELAGHEPLSFQTRASVGGGTDQTQYYASGLNEHDGGIITNTYFDKQSANIKLDQQFPLFSYEIGSHFSHSASGRGLTNNDNITATFYAAMPFIPNFLDLRQLPNGTYPVNPFGTSNPLQTAALLHNDENTYRYIGSADATLNILNTEQQRLKLVAVGGLDVFSQQNHLYSPPELQFEQAFGTNGTSVLTNTVNLFTNINLALVHVFTPRGGAFTATTTLGGQQETRNENLNTGLGQHLSGDLSNIDKGTTSQLFEQRTNIVDKGLFAQEEFLTLNDRLLLTAGVRADQSSNNAHVNTLYVYPKGSASYRIPLNSTILPELKVRAAVGESGNEPQYGFKFGELNSYNYGGLPLYQIGGQIASPDLKPERELEVEGGVDLTLFKGRATLGITGYQKRITDLLLQRVLPGSFGDTIEILNGGTLRTRGIEVEASVVALQGRHVQWTIDANFAKDASLVTSLPVAPFSPAGFPVTFGAFEIQQGKSPTQIIGNITLPNGTVTTGQIGDVNPDYKVGLANTISVGPFHLYFLFSAQKGGDDINLTELLYDLGKNTADYAQPMKVGDSTVMKGAYRVSQWPTHTAIYVQDASFIKLREVTLSYDLPIALFGPIGRGFRWATLSVSGRNLYTWTNYVGMDPEVSNFGNQNIARNVDVGPFPPSRVFWFGVNLGF